MAWGVLLRRSWGIDALRCPACDGRMVLISAIEEPSEDHLALFLLDVVKQLDLSTIFAHYERELRGYPPHHPRMMVTLLLYAYCVGVPSSRKIERRTHEDIAFRVLSANTHPDHKSISEFRRIHLPSLATLFVQVLKLCQKAGLVKLGHVALDGTKMKANASKHKAMSFERMQKDEAALEDKVKELLAAAASADAAEDAQHGKDRRGDELPEDLRRATDRLARIHERRGRPTLAHPDAGPARQPCEWCGEFRLCPDRLEQQIARRVEAVPIELSQNVDRPQQRVIRAKALGLFHQGSPQLASTDLGGDTLHDLLYDFVLDRE